jgi:hypothetical protein
MLRNARTLLAACPCPVPIMATRMRGGAAASGEAASAAHYPQLVPDNHGRLSANPNDMNCNAA